MPLIVQDVCGKNLWTGKKDTNLEKGSSPKFLAVAASLLLLVILAASLPCFAASEPHSALDGAAGITEEQKTFLKLINQERKKKRLPEVSLGDENHQAAARLRAKELTEKYSYIRPNGKRDFTVLEEFEIRDVSVGEAYIGGCSTPEAAMQEWMQISFTRERILNEDAATVSVGSCTGGAYQNYWVLIFTYPAESCVEEFRQEILELVNAEREKEGLPALEMGDAALTAAAQLRAQEIAQQASHTRPDGRSCFTALEDCGSTDRPVGENAAWGCASPEEVVKAWMKSPAHRESILDPDAGKLGVGYYYDASSEYGHQWIQLFAE